MLLRPILADDHFRPQLLLAAVGLIYAPLAPLVPAFAAVAITIASATYKFQLCYIYSNEIETGGSAWPVVIDRLLLNVVLMNLSLVLSASTPLL